MDRLKSSLQTHCPNGVPYFALSDLIISLKTGLNPRKNFVLNEPGANCAYITGKDIFNNTVNVTEKTDKITSNTVEMISRRSCLESDIVLFASTGTGTVGRMAWVKHYDGTWNISETLFAIKLKPIIIPEYFMCIMNSGHAVNQYAPFISKGSVPHLKINDLLKISLPVPPLEVQEAVVRILGKYTEKHIQLIDALSAELEARKVQYEYYREKLMEPREDWYRSTLLETLTQAITDGPHETPKLVEKGIPFISAEALSNNRINFDLMRGYITEEYDEICCKKYKPQLGDIYMCKSGSTTGKVAMVETEERFNIWSPLAAIRVDQKKILPRYMFFYLQTSMIQKQVQAKASKGSQPNLSMRKLEQFEVAYPDIQDQKRILDLLDKYNEVYSQYIDTLQREIQLRQAQYEYYRDKLLTFQEAN